MNEVQPMVARLAGQGEIYREPERVGFPSPGREQREGELPCVLVYSDRLHVDHIYVLLSQLEEVLETRGFRPIRLGDEIRSTEEYLCKLESIVGDCALGVVVLDGFRPNVLFELGFLLGKKIPTIVMQSRDAQISVRTLYESRKDSGLTETAFKRLENPPIDLKKQLSDFGARHVAYVDWKTKKGDPRYPQVVLE